MISCIMATYGRYEEPLLFVKSLLKQDLSKDLFELIVVDQNEEYALEESILKFAQKINIVYIRSSAKGLSRNRNIGLNASRKKYVCFPDDDCVYYADTLSRALKRLTDTEASIILGRVYDRNNEVPILKKWPEKAKIIKVWRFYGFSTSINIFARRVDIYFNENLGVGTYYGSCEDLDFIYRYLMKYGYALYFPDIEVWHPSPKLRDISREKVESYGLGFGKFCALHRKQLPILFLFGSALCYHTLQGLTQLLCLKTEGAKKRFVAVSSRLSSFFSVD